MKKYLFRPIGSNNQRGGAAIEYVLVSMFATAVSLVGIGYIGKLVKDKVQKFSAQYKIDTDAEGFDFDGF